MTDSELNRRQCYIETLETLETHHEEKIQLQHPQHPRHPRHKCQFSKNITEILDIRYEDLRRKVIEVEDNKSFSPSPFSQELLIFIQQGMIAWVEQWSKCHPVNTVNTINTINHINIAMSDSHKIDEPDFIDIDNNTDDNNHIDGRRDTAFTRFHLSISMDLQAQLKNLLTHMAISTIFLSTNLET